MKNDSFESSDDLRIIFCLPVPSKQGRKSPGQTEYPDEEDAAKSSVLGHRLGSDTSHDYVVPVKGNHGHRPN